MMTFLIVVLVLFTALVLFGAAVSGSVTTLG
jgi:hypothetical protein